MSGIYGAYEGARPSGYPPEAKPAPRSAELD